MTFFKSRRELLRALGALPFWSASASASVVACASDPGTTGSSPSPQPTGTSLPPGTPPPSDAASGANTATDAATADVVPTTCGSLTDPSIEGPYFKASSPERTSIVGGAPSTAPRMTLRGTVRTPGCQPIAGALIELWQANENGEYDNDGFHLRGHQFTNAKGEYSFETVVPGLYPGRTRHLHVKVQPKGGAILTTQLYFPNDPGNAADNFYLPTLLMTIANPGAAPTEAAFDFVVQV